MRKIDADSVEIIDVECFEVSSFDNDETLIESVKRKVLKNGVPRQYGKGTVLAGFVRRTSIVQIAQVDLIKQLNPSCGSIALLIDESVGVTVRTWVQMFPEYQKVVFDFKLSGKNKYKHHTYICAAKGFLNQFQIMKLFKLRCFQQVKIHML